MKDLNAAGVARPLGTNTLSEYNLCKINSTHFKPKWTIQVLSPDCDTFKYNYVGINISPGQVEKN